MAYSTVSQVAELLGITIDSESHPSDSEVEHFIAWADAEIDAYAGTKFSPTQVSEELVDIETDSPFIVPRHLPIISVASLHYRASPLNAAEAWEELLEGPGAGTHFTVLKGTYLGQVLGHSIYVYGRSLSKGPGRLKISYTYGFPSTPELVSELSAHLAALKVIMARHGRELSGLYGLDAKIGDVSIQDTLRTSPQELIVAVLSMRDLLPRFGRLPCILL